MLSEPMLAAIEDFDSVVDLVNECFPYERDGGGMQFRWPHCYIRRPDQFRNRFIIRDNDKIVSHIGYIHQTIMIEDSEIEVAGLTDVSTAPDYRGKGLMTKLINYSIPIIKEQGYAFCDLGGDRQRYAHFGWENAGREWQYIITQRSLANSNSEFEFEATPFRGTTKETDCIISIHEQEPLKMKRSGELYELLLKRKGRQTWVASGRQGIVSYLVSNQMDKECEISEFGGKNEGLYAIFRCLSNDYKKPLRVHSPCRHPSNRFFASISSDWSVTPFRMVKIFDIETTLKGFSNQILRRIQETGIRNAERVPIMVHGDYKCTEICFSSDQVSIDRTDNLNDSFVLSEQEAVRFLFGQCPPDSMFSLSHNKGVLNSVLPLDFYIWNNDTV